MGSASPSIDACSLALRSRAVELKREALVDISAKAVLDACRASAPAGTGPGLSRVRASLDFSGGEMSAETTPAGGTQFRLVVPLPHAG